MTTLTPTNVPSYLDKEFELTERQNKILPFTDGITAIEGRKGTGKTTLAIALIWYIREEFGLPVLCDFPLLPKFGKYEHFDIKTFVANLKIIGEQTKGFEKGVAERQLDNLMKEGKMPVIVDSVILLDEAYQYLDSRTPNDPVTRLMGHWISQIRHYRSPLIFITPSMDMIDKRVRRQVDRVMKCQTSLDDDPDSPFYGKLVTNAFGDDYNLDEDLEITVNAERFQTMFNSWILRPIRSATLSGVKEKDK